MNKKLAEKRLTIPQIYRANYDKAMTGKSPKAAMKAFCLECVVWQREEVKKCTSPTCPLYPYRPYKESKAPDNEGLFSARGAEPAEGGNYES